MQRENAVNIPTRSKFNNSTIELFDTYEKIGANDTTINDAHNRSNGCQLRGTYRMDSESEYDIVEDSHTQNALKQPSAGVNGTKFNKMIPQDYEPIYFYGSSTTQIKELTGKQILFDDERYYGAHRPVPRRAAVRLRVDGVEDKPSSETVKEETPIAKRKCSMLSH